MAPTLWFEWNKVDLSQFDAAVVGAGVSTNSISVVTTAGESWVRIDATPVGGNVSIISGLVLLTISTTPPSANYFIETDYVRLDSSTVQIAGAILVGRYVSLTQSYWLEEQNMNPVSRKLTLTSKAYLDVIFAGAPSPAAQVALRPLGQRMQLKFDGGVSSVQCGMLTHIFETEADATPHTAAGKAGIGASCGQTNLLGTVDSPGSAVSVLLRRIRCFTL